MIAYIAVGSNLDGKHKHIQDALHHISLLPDTLLSRQSNWHVTAPVGLPDDAEMFINGVIEVETTLPPHELMNALLEIEKKMGRIRTQHHGYQSRIIDLDLLMVDDVALNEPGLVLPHPRMTERMFVMLPLNELCPEKLINRKNITVHEALKKLCGVQA